MNSMEISRRHALVLAAAFALSPDAARSQSTISGYISAYTTPSWRHGISLLDRDGNVTAKFDLPSRGHGVAVDPFGKHAILFARRPGTYFAVVNLQSPRLTQLIECRDDRHFYGHGCFSADGRHLFATENDFENERGLLGIYDAAEDFRRIGELPSYGIGPHEVVLMPDGETLAIANGGVLTHPSAPRLKLNVADMKPSLAFVRIRDGEQLAAHHTIEDLHKLSIRHMAVNSNGQIAIAMQWEGSALELPPLVAIWSAGDGLRLIQAPDEVQRAMQNYCGSVAYAMDGDGFIVSSPRGNILTKWSNEGFFQRSFELRDGGGLAPRPEGGFIATNGMGTVMAVEPQNGGMVTLASHAEMMWDNHIVGY